MRSPYRWGVVFHGNHYWIWKLVLNPQTQISGKGIEVVGRGQLVITYSYHMKLPWDAIRRCGGDGEQGTCLCQEGAGNSISMRTETVVLRTVADLILCLPWAVHLHIEQVLGLEAVNLAITFIIHMTNFNLFQDPDSSFLIGQFKELAQWLN